MEKYTHHTLPIQDYWTYDTVANFERTAMITEPLAIMTASGLRMIPVNFNYKKCGGKFERQIIEYGLASKYLSSTELDRYLIWDEEAQVVIIGIPLDEQTQVLKARNALRQFTDNNSPITRALLRLIEFFPDQEFGLFGSSALRVRNHDSDLDLFVYGGKSFSFVSRLLEDIRIQSHLQIFPLTNAELEAHAQRYVKRFKVTPEKGRRIASLRSRYWLGVDGQERIKVALSSCFDRQEYRLQTILGSKKIGNVLLEGVIVNTDNASSFPREHIAEIDSQRIQILSMQWVLQRLARVGDRVSIRANLREKGGSQFLSLEGENDMISPISNKK